MYQVVAVLGREKKARTRYPRGASHLKSKSPQRVETRTLKQ